MLLARVLKGFTDWLAPATPRVTDDLPQQTEAGLMSHLRSAMPTCYEMDVWLATSHNHAISCGKGIRGLSTLVLK